MSSEFSNNTYDNRPIAVFDSGVGGLSILKCIYQQLPQENLLYLADNLNAPYGDKSELFIQDRLTTLCTWLHSKNIKALVIACNTATVSAIDILRQRFSFPIVGVEPAIKPEVKMSTNKKIALLVTQATANNKRFLALVDQHKAQAKVIIQPCPGLVEKIEHGEKNITKCIQLLDKYLTQVLDSQIDTLVLGCTHYPLIQHHIKTICGEKITIMETAKPVTTQLSRVLEQHNSAANFNHKGKVQFYCSNPSPNQQRLFAQFWPQPISLKNMI